MKTYKRILVLLLVITAVLGIGGQAIALESDIENLEDAAEDEVSGFTRNYTEYLSSTAVYVIFVEDTNWYSGDNYVTVRFYQSQGPTSVTAKVEYLSGSSWVLANSSTLDTGDSFGASIPGGATFRVNAKKSTGNSGDVTLRVTLED
jgi:predicted RND superfamily exporter protein